ncbi:MAG: TonB-dependent receptor [Rhodospirillaceae bacterium]
MGVDMTANGAGAGNGLREGAGGRDGRDGRGGFRPAARGLLLGVTMLALAAPASAADGQHRLVEPDAGSLARLAGGNPQLAQAGGPQRFSIPAGDLQSALLAFSQAADLQLIYPADLTDGLRTQGLQGSFAPREALARLLAGTPLTFEFSDSQTVTIARLSDGSGATVIGPITVEGQGAPRHTEIGNLPPEYAGGQVARGGKLGILGNRDTMDTPFSQTSFTRTHVEDEQAQSLGHVVENDPSVHSNFTTGTGIDQFIIRGFASGNQDVTFGGLYGITPTSNSMMAVEGLERVEVLKGPSTLLNGLGPQGSVGGTINVVPKRAGDRPITQFTPGYDSDGQAGGHVDVGRRIGPDDSVGIRFNGAYRNGDTAIDRQSHETGLAAVGLDFRGESVRLSADLGYQLQDTDVTRRPVGLAAGVAVPEAPDGSSNWSQSFTFAETQNTYGVLRGEVDLTDNLTAFAAVGGSVLRFRSISENRTLQDTQGTITGNPFALRLYEETTTVETGLRGTFATGQVDHEFTVAGTKFWKEGGSAFTAAAFPASNLYNPALFAEPNFGALPDPGDAPKTGEQEFTSVVLADTVSAFDERIQLTLGARFQDVLQESYDRATGVRTSKYDDSAVTPAVGLIVKPWRNVSVYANFIEGLQQGAAAPATAANAGELFPPHVTEQYEAGVKVDFGRLAMVASVFQITQPSGLTDPTTNVFSVDAEQRNRGLEFTTFGEAAEGVRVLGGVTLIESELTKTQGGANDGNRARGVPALRASIGGEWDTPFLKGLTLWGRMIHTSSQFVDAANRQETPDWTRFDFGARYSLEAYGTPVVVRATVENAFDADYWATADGALGLGAPRTFRLSASFGF